MKENIIGFLVCLVAVSAFLGAMLYDDSTHMSRNPHAISE
jgi:hypothetical protein